MPGYFEDEINGNNLMDISTNQWRALEFLGKNGAWLMYNTVQQSISLSYWAVFVLNDQSYHSDAYPFYFYTLHWYSSNHLFF